MDASFCLQRRMTQLYNIPLTRFSPVNPYTSGTYTKAQLDMRRKAEVLKYSANKSSTQTNNLTKKDKFAFLAKTGTYKSRSQAVIQSNNICDADNMMMTPTSSCDVPGPVVMLYDDETVPLYNYSDFNTRTYPNYVPPNADPWQFVVLSNILIYDNGTSNIYYLIINNNINQKSYVYNLVVPIGLSITGKIPVSYSPPSDFSGNLSLSISNVSLSIYYSGNLVKQVSPASLTDFGLQINVPYSNSTSSPLLFSATRFIGNLSFNGISLFTMPTYVYTFVFTANITVSPSSVSSSLVTYTAVIANMLQSAEENTGCTVLSTSNATNNGASITWT